MASSNPFHLQNNNKNRVNFHSKIHWLHGRENTLFVGGRYTVQLVGIMPNKKECYSNANQSHWRQCSLHGSIRATIWPVQIILQ